MRTWFCLAALLVLAGTTGGSSSAASDQAKPGANVCITILEGPNDNESWWFAYERPGPGRRLVAHIQPTADCEAIVAAFEHGTSKVVEGWSPQYVAITSGTQVVLPSPPQQWKWEEEDRRRLDIYVLLLAPGSSEIGELRKLVAGMADRKTEAVARLQGAKLRELISKADPANQKDRGATEDPKVTGGTAGLFRSVESFRPGGGRREFDWHHYARHVSFSASEPGYLLFSDAK